MARPGRNELRRFTWTDPDARLTSLAALPYIAARRAGLALAGD
jgi:hypothetical protein